MKNISKCSPRKPKVHLTKLKRNIIKFLSEKANISNNMNNLHSINPIDIEIAEKIHKKRFREYCNQLLDPKLDELLSETLTKLAFFQKRSYIAYKNSQGIFKKRFVFGFHEVYSRLSIGNQIKFIIFVPDIQNIDVLNDYVIKLILKAREHRIPVIFSSNRYKLGAALRVYSTVSVLAVLDYNNADEHIKDIFQLAENGRQKYLNKIHELNSDMNNIERQIKKLTIN